MAAAGPFGSGRRVAVGVSGGADSMALAWLLAGWGRPTALIVDHGLRAHSDDEAKLTARRLTAVGIEAHVLPRLGLAVGSGLAERARIGRYGALGQACRAMGLADLLVAHHAQDQAETVLIRRQAGSGSAGLAGMPKLSAKDDVRLVRPLLGVSPDRLRATLEAAGLAWVDDPGNHDRRSPRGRLRAGFHAGSAPGIDDTLREAERHGRERTGRESAVAAELAERVTLLPCGVVSIASPTLSAAALSAVLWTVSGAAHPPATAAVARMTRLHPGTLHGVAIVPGHGGWLVGREAGAQSAPVTALAGSVWDRRFRLGCTLAGGTIGALGDDAARLRRWSNLPAAMLRTVPALRRDGVLFAVPHLSYPDAHTCGALPVAFCPARPAAPAPFVAA